MGKLQVNGDLTLFDASTRIPTLTWIRGGSSDSYTDWRIQASGGNLYIQHSTAGEAWITSFQLNENSQNGTISTPYAISAAGGFAGNASTATKLATARTINGTSFDGTSNITTSTWGTARNISITDAYNAHTSSAVSINGSQNYSLKLPSIIKSDKLDSNLQHGFAMTDGVTNKFYKVASLTQDTSKYQINTTLILMVSGYYGSSNGFNGLLKINCRWEAGGTAPSFCTCEWITADSNLNKDAFILTYKNGTTLNLYVYLYTAWQSVNFTKLAEHNWGSALGRFDWTFYSANSTSAQCLSAIPSGETQIASTLTTIQNSAVSANSVTWGNISGKPSSFTPASHTHNIENLTNFSSRIYDATVSRTANTFLAAPNGSAGSASFRKLVAADLPSHSHSYLPLSGGNLTGHVYLTKAVSNSSTSNTSQIVFGTSSNNHVALSSNTHALIINPSLNSTTGQIILSTDSVSTFTHGVNYATSAGSASSASSVPWSGITGKPSTFTPSSHTHTYLDSGGNPTSSSSHADALQKYFSSNKASIPRNSLLTFYSSAMSNGSQYMGYFLAGYDSTPYGGFFVAHYDNPFYVGISSGTFNQQHILTSTNYASYCIPSNSYISTTTNVGGDAILKVFGRTDMGCLRLTNDSWTGYGYDDPNSAGLSTVEGRVYFRIVG